MAAILEREPPPLTETFYSHPALLDHLVKRCLAKDPDSRWQSPLDVKAQLQWIAANRAREEDIATSVARGTGIAMGHRWGGDGPPDLV